MEGGGREGGNRVVGRRKEVRGGEEVFQKKDGREGVGEERGGRRREKN